MSTIIGWDIGGAHLKAARVESGIVTGAVQLPSPLWLGVDKLATAFAHAARAMGASARHAVTMTGELADIFASRAEGVQDLARIAWDCLGDVDILFYGGPAGFLRIGELENHVGEVASANWHASARWAAHALQEGLFVDMGSTTTDLVGFRDGEVAAYGYADAERLATGELVYTGLVRSFLMSIAPSVPFRGHVMPLMNEYFANMADVYRVLGELPAGADQQATADGRDKSVAASRARLGRMLGLDVADATEAAWTEVAQSFREAQLRKLHDAALLVLSRGHLADAAPVVGAGIGTKIIRELARRLRRPYRPFADMLSAVSPAVRRSASDCAPAAATALLMQTLC